MRNHGRDPHVRFVNPDCGGSICTLRQRSVRILTGLPGRMSFRDASSPSERNRIRVVNQAGFVGWLGTDVRHAEASTKTPGCDADVTGVCLPRLTLSGPELMSSAAPQPNEPPQRPAPPIRFSRPSHSCCPPISGDPDAVNAAAVARVWPSAAARQVRGCQSLTAATSLPPSGWSTRAITPRSPPRSGRGRWPSPARDIPCRRRRREAVGGLRREQEMVDAEAGVALPAAGGIVPEGVDRALPDSGRGSRR